MPRPKTDTWYVEQVATLAAEGERPPTIFRRIQETAERAGRNDYPSERTVRRLYEAHKSEPIQLQKEAAFFRWPATMVEGLLPWQASRAALDLVRFRDEHGAGRPTVREAKWYWRVVTAAPEIDPQEAAAAAAFFTTREFAETMGRADDIDAEPGEWRLVYQPWRSKRDASAYQKASSPKAAGRARSAWSMPRGNAELQDHFRTVRLGPEMARRRREALERFERLQRERDGEHGEEG
jgi:hypothetical protein